MSKTGRLEDYEIIDRFAVGGAAELYRARDKSSGQVVAIKRMRQDVGFDPEMSAGFLRETQLAMLSDHKNLIQGFAQGSHEGADWVALHYVAGKDLHTLLDRARDHGERLSAGISLFIAREILDGLAFAYNMVDPTGGPMGLVHRDLNPRNVLLSFSGGVHVADFGASIASLTEPPPAEIVGSLGYMSPEQTTLSHLDARSDIFAVGCILFEMVAGQGAIDFDPRKEAAAIKAHQRAKLRRIPRDVTDGIKMLIEISTSRDREDRYMSATQMRDLIDRQLKDMGETQLPARLARVLVSAFPEDADKAKV
jgi:serine/threonine-protein kinase